MELNTQIPKVVIPPASAPVMPAAPVSVMPTMPPTAPLSLRRSRLLLFGLAILALVLVSGGVFLLSQKPPVRDVSPIVKALEARQARTLSAQEKEAVITKLKSAVPRELSETEQEKILQALQNKK